MGDDNDVDHHHDMPLGEALSLPPLPTSPLPGPPVPDVASGGVAVRPSSRPTTFGPTLLCAPPPLPLSAAAAGAAALGAVGGVGKAFRVTGLESGAGCSIELLQVTSDDGGNDDEDARQSVSVQYQLGVPDSTAIHVACSHDASLVAVAYTDGSIRCYDVSLSPLSPAEGGGGGFRGQRWILPEAHSGSVVSLAFGPPSGGTTTQPLLLVHTASTPRREVTGGGTATLYDAHTGRPTPTPPVTNVFSAAFHPSDPTMLALGFGVGSVRIVRLEEGSQERILAIMSPPVPTEEEDEEEAKGAWITTHLHWVAPTQLLVGLCRVNPSGFDSEEEEEEEDDDPNEHEANLYVATLHASTLEVQRWSELGDVAPFFSVPKGGRHQFYTSVLPCRRDVEQDSSSSSSMPMGPATSMVLVGCNVSSEVNLVTHQQDADVGGWEVTELQEGSNIQTPTDEDDEFTYPTGLSVVLSDAGEEEEPGERGRVTVLLSSTDGSASSFALRHVADESFGTVDLQAAMEKAAAASTTAFASPGGGFASLGALATAAVATTEEEGDAASDVADRGVVTADDYAEVGALLSRGFDDNEDEDEDEYDEDEEDEEESTVSDDEEVEPTPLFGDGGISKLDFGSPSFSFGTAPAPAPAPAGGSGFGFGVAPAPAPAPAGGGGFSFGGAGGAATATKAPTVGGFAFGSTGGSTFGSPSALGAGAGGGGGGSSSLFSTPPKTGETATEGKNKDAQETKEKDATAADKTTATTTATPVFGSTTTTAATPIFGSGSSKSIPTFGGAGAGAASSGFGALSAAAQSSPSKGFGAPLATSPLVSKGGAFGGGTVAAAGGGGGAVTAGGLATSMIKPLFAPPPAPATSAVDANKEEEEKKEKSVVPVKSVDTSPSDAPKKEDAASIPPKDDNKEEGETAAAPEDTAEARRAASVFDEVDSSVHDGTKTGTVPASEFEALLDGVGEGFHGDEFDLQLALVDPDGSGTVNRSAFVRWYGRLVEEGGPGGGGSDADESLCTEEREERDEERAKATGAFQSMVPAGKTSIPKGDFGKLMESMGTTYCEEEHRRTIRKISSSDGTIEEDAFVSWYMDWLFGDGSDSEEEDEEEEEEEAKDKGEGASAPSQGDGWGSRFQVDAGSWKCNACMVTNKADATACAACETARPGHEGAPKGEADKKGGAGVSGSSIGSGGFTFGGAALAASTPSKKGEPAAPLSSAPTGGFTFGGAATAKKDDISATTSIGKGGFTFGSVPAAPATAPAPASSISSKGFSFGTTTAAPTTTAIKPVTAAGGNPPLSGKAPTPFSASKEAPSATTPKDEKFVPSKTSTAAPPKPSGSYPPMSMQAPTPFGANKITSASSTAQSSYPPISKAAPSPFSAVPTKESLKVSGSSAPTPSTGFGFSAKKDVAPKPTPPGYPPVSSTAPTPFSAGKASTAAPSTSGSYPPLATTAPRPFGAGVAAKTPKPNASASKPGASGFGFATDASLQAKPATSGYPPVSSKAPTPFSAGKPSSATAYPPVAAKAPKPFGASAPSASQSTAASTSVKSSAAGFGIEKGSLGYPPVPSKAPTPFGASKADGVAPSAGAYPPIASKAPTPFASGAKSSQPTSVATSNAMPSGLAISTRKEVSARPDVSGYPPVPSKAPTPFFSTKKDPGESASAKSAVPASASKYVAASEYEAQLWGLVRDFDVALSSLRDRKTKKFDDSELESSIEKLVEGSQKCIPTAVMLDERLSEERNRSVFFLSQRDDVERQIRESQRLIDEQTPSTDGAPSRADLLKQQPLDAESEERRRRLAAQAVATKRMISSVQEKNRLNERLFSCNTGTDDKFYSPTFLQQKRPSSADASIEANKALFDALTRAFDRTRQLEASADTLEQHINRVSKTAVSAHRQNNNGALVRRPGGKQHVGGVFSPPSRRIGSKQKILPLPVKFSSALVSKPISASEATYCTQKRIQASMRKLTNYADKISVKTLSVRRPLSTSKESSQGTGPHDWRSVGKNRLMGGPRLTSPLPTGSRPTAPSFAKKDLFPSTSVPLRARADWHVVSNVDQSKVSALSLTLPKDVKHISADLAAKEALAPYGTTPEKAAKAREAMARGERLKVQQDAKGSKGQLVAPKTSSSAAFPPMSSKAPTPFSKTQKPSSAAFPPMAKSAPTPFSQALPSTKAGATAKGIAAASLATPPSKMQDAANKSTAPASGETTKSTAEKQDKSNLFSFSGLGDTLGASKLPEKPGVGVLGGSLLSTIEKGQHPNYKSVLTAFYEKHNPGKLGDVDRTLEKYKGKEVQMFSALGKRYGVPSPLSGTSAVSSSSSPLKGDSFGSARLSHSLSASQGAGQPDYTKILTEFYQKHAPAKVADVDRTLIKYKGKEVPMFAALAKKYSTSNPLAQGDTASSASSQAVSSSSSATGSSVSLTAPTPAAPTAAGTSFLSTLPTTAPAPAQVDYKAVLSQFYQKHNPSKVGEVEKNLAKYQGREAEMFAKLAQKYGVKNPLEEQSKAAPTPFGASPPTAASPFGQAAPSQPTPAFPSGSATSTTASQSPFSVASGTMGSTTMSSTSPFGGGAAQPAPSPFDAKPSGFGAFGGSSSGAAPSSLPFGQAPAAAAPSPFGATPTPFSSSGTGSFGKPAPSPSPFGAAPVSTAMPAAPDPTKKFGGRNPRDILISFYQSHNPTKVAEVDKLLAKYAGKEEQMFLNLAKKYNLNPSMFGISGAAAPVPVGATFGSPGTTTGGFGQASALGGGSGFGAGMAAAPSPFGAPPGGAGGGFGSTSSLGGGARPSAFGATTSGFGSLAGPGGAGASGFGSIAGAGGGFGAASPSGFGGSSPFGSARR